MGTEWNAENHVNDALRVETVLRQESKIQPYTCMPWLWTEAPFPRYSAQPHFVSFRGKKPQPVKLLMLKCTFHNHLEVVWKKTHKATTPAALPNAEVYLKKPKNWQLIRFKQGDREEQQDQGRRLLLSIPFSMNGTAVAATTPWAQAPQAQQNSQTGKMLLQPPCKILFYLIRRQLNLSNNVSLSMGTYWWC